MGGEGKGARQPSWNVTRSHVGDNNSTVFVHTWSHGGFFLWLFSVAVLSFRRGFWFVGSTTCLQVCTSLVHPRAAALPISSLGCPPRHRERRGAGHNEAFSPATSAIIQVERSCGPRHLPCTSAVPQSLATFSRGRWFFMERCATRTDRQSRPSNHSLLPLVRVSSPLDPCRRVRELLVQTEGGERGYSRVSLRKL